MIQPFLPMLAVSASPFDASAYFFEVKWDGVRALAAVQAGQWRLWGRDLADYGERYPELDVLRSLPSGTVVDGELVVLQDGRPNLPALLQRHQQTQALRIRHAARHSPVHYVLFDLLYHQGRSLISEPFTQRLTALTEVLAAKETSVLRLSQGIAEQGRDFFAQVVAQGHEGVMAKHQSSRYVTGQRCACWKKIKPARLLPCVIIGYTPCRAGLHSVLVASAAQGPLRYVAQLSCGFSARQKVELSRLLEQRHRSRPVVPCTRHAIWVEPDLYCRVRFLQWTVHGRLRSASFAGLIEPNSEP